MNAALTVVATQRAIGSNALAPRSLLRRAALAIALSAALAGCKVGPDYVRQVGS